MSPGERDAIRDLCLAVATLGHRCAPLIGTDAAGHVLDLAGRVSALMDDLDAAGSAGTEGRNE